jgi:polysaccharide deacetylase 2 family uncharacterized protein YibQ
MKRRKGRRKTRARRSPLQAVAGLLALAVVVAAGVLIARGDRSPRPPRTVAHQRQHAAVAAASSAAAPAPGMLGPSFSPTPPPLGASPPTLPPQAAGASGAPSAGAAPSATPSAPRLALIIDDCGQWPDTERGFIALPVALTLSVLPHVRYGDAIARDARAAGKGVMLHLPMEPRSGAYPGPGEITVAMDDAAIAAQVRDDIASVPLAAGVNNHEGSRATADDRVMRAVSAVIAEHRLFFVDSRTGADSVAARDAAAAGIATASRDVFLDDVAELGATEDELRRAAALAKQHGSAIAIGHPRPTTLAAVRALLPELRRAGIDFVLAADVVR